MRSEKQDAKVNSTESAPRGATDSAKTANEGRGSGSQAAFTQYVRNIQAKGGQPVAGPEAQEAAAKGETHTPHAVDDSRPCARPSPLQKCQLTCAVLARGV